MWGSHHCFHITQDLPRCYLSGSLVTPLPTASSVHEPEEPFHGAGPWPGCPVLLSGNSSRGVRGFLGVRMRVILASASIIAKSAATSSMPGVRSGVGIASVASRCPWGSWAGVAVEGTGVNEEAWSMGSFPCQREHSLCQNLGACGRAKLCFMKGFPPLPLFLFPSTLVRDSRQKAWQRPGLLQQLTQRMGLNREQSRHCSSTAQRKVGQRRKCRFDRTGN